MAAAAAPVAAAARTYGGSINRKAAAPVVEAEETEEEEEGETFDWTEENITAFAQESLGSHDSLFFEPKIPAKKLKSARTMHADTLEHDEKVLVLFDDTVFGSAEEGFAITTDHFVWKNILEDPNALLWTEIDPDAIGWSETELTVNGTTVQLTQGDTKALYPALGNFISEMATMAAAFGDDEEEEEEDA